MALTVHCLQGDTAAFEQILERYQRPIFNIALRMVHDHEDARDVAQNVFVKAYENLRSYDPRFKLFSWLYRMAINESVNLLKKRKSAIKASMQMRLERQAQPETVEQDGAGGKLGKALKMLKPEDRIVVVLKHVSGCSYRDLSEILEIPVKRVKSRLFEARRRLREILSSERSSAYDRNTIP